MKLDSIGKNIRIYRNLRKMRQEDLAEKTGLSVAYIGMVERAEKIPSLETLISILNALEISSDMVLNGVLTTGYEVKDSLLHEKLLKISADDREKIYAVIDTMISFSKYDIK